MTPDRLIGPVSFLGRLILLMRLYSLLLIVLWMDPAQSRVSIASLGLVVIVVALASFLPLWYWDRLAPYLLRRPALLAADAFLSIGLLFLAGVESPALHFALTTAALSGLLHGYRGALGICVLLVAGYEAALASSGQMAGASFQLLLGAPALAPMAAVAGGSVRQLLGRQERIEQALNRAVHDAAVGEERSRLAREMHDSLTKTLQGIALSAMALQRSTADTPAMHMASQLADAAKAASDEARQLIGDLRIDRLDMPLVRAVAEFVRSWSQRTGITVTTDVSGAFDQHLTSEGRYEVFCVIKEALRNIERHARATSVSVTACPSADASGITIAVADDGTGFARPPHLEDLAYRGRYGVVGMAERARRAGGRLDVTTAPGAGTRVSVHLPIASGDAPLPGVVARPVARELPL